MAVLFSSIAPFPSRDGKCWEYVLMAKVRIVAGGETEKAQANARGALFEEVVAELLRHHGYTIDEHNASVMHAGMEIDVEGRATVTGVPLYAECKCYASDVTADKLHTFFGKYMTRWLANDKCHGLFVALPGVNSHAKGFYDESCASEPRLTIKLLQEHDVLHALVDGRVVISQDAVKSQIDPSQGHPGDCVLLCTDKGFFWLVYVVPLGSGIAKHVQLFDDLGHHMSDQGTLDYLTDLVDELQQFHVISAPQTVGRIAAVVPEDGDQIVEVRGSSSCFEYQFPASPEFFVGREQLLRNVQNYVRDILLGEVSSRAILFRANSGWGKSSAVLATVARLQSQGHFAVAIDSRSASSSQFVLKAVDYVLRKLGDFGGLVTQPPVVSGFESAVAELVRVGNVLREHGKLLAVFFDQFENVFYLLDVLTAIARMCLKVGDSGTHVMFGFSWKADQIGLIGDFPYRWRDSIADCCQTFRLKKFSENETNALLDRLADEMRTTLRKDLRFLLSEFSQGYPWLLKKLCAHVRKQRTDGVPQADIARGLLNVQQLFLEDIEGLSAEEETALRAVARMAPVSVSELGEQLQPEVVQALVNRRLLVKVGPKYDVYWDIFRDYLNTDKLPIQEAYLLRAQVGSVLRAIGILQRAGGTVKTVEFKRSARLSDGAFLNVARDMRLLDIANIERDQLQLSFPSFSSESETLEHLRGHLAERLAHNRPVDAVLKRLHSDSELPISDVAKILREQFPYISASEKTWMTYARVLTYWLDLADLAILDQKKTFLSPFEVGAQIRERTLPLMPKRTGVSVPRIHFSPVVQVATRLVSAVQKNERADWSGISRSTIYKALSALEEMKLIERKSKIILVLAGCRAFALQADVRVELAREQALSWPTFRALIDILNDHARRRLTHRQLGAAVREKCRLSWKESMAETNVRIMMDWARHLGLAPGVYRHARRGRFRRTPRTPSLFDGDEARSSGVSNK